MSSLSHQVTVPVEQDESVIAGLLQVTRRYVLVGAVAQDHLPTMELLARPGASDIMSWDLATPDEGWKYAHIPLEENEEILVFKLDEDRNVLAFATWYDETPEIPEIKMRLHVLDFDTMSPILPPKTFSVAWKTGEFRDEAPVAFIETHQDLVGVRVSEHIQQSHLRVWNWRTGRLLLHRISRRAEEGQSFAFVSDKTVAITNSVNGSVDLVPIDPSSSQHIHRLMLSPSIIPRASGTFATDPPPKPAVACLAGHNIVVAQLQASGESLPDKTQLVFTRDALLKHSAETCPPFPNLSVDQLVDGDVIIPWSTWNEDVKVLQSHDASPFLVNGKWLVRRVAEDGRYRFKVLEFVNGKGKVVLEEVTEYAEILVHEGARRVFGLQVIPYGGNGDSTLDAIDVYDVR